MERNIKLFIIVACILSCDGVSWRRQLQHIVKSRLESLGQNNELASRRFYQYDPRELSSILGVPSQPSHLPEAEPILPGHTLLKPSLGMLKSSVKFPHRELEDGAGVYGNIENLGIRYDARNERWLHSGFRRSPSDYIMVVPSKPSTIKKPRFNLASVVLDLERKGIAKSVLLKILKRLNIHKGANVIVATLDDLDPRESTDKDISYYLNSKSLHSFPELLELKSPILRTFYEDNISKEDENKDQETASKSLEAGKINKMKWMIKSKDRYNNIKINQDAPEITELIPNYEDKLRKWWFYNADDYKPFKD